MASESPTDVEASVVLNTSVANVVDANESEDGSVVASGETGENESAGSVAEVEGQRQAAPAHAGGGAGSGGYSSKEKSPAQVKEDFSRVAQSLREDASDGKYKAAEESIKMRLADENDKRARVVAAMEEMRKRAARYRETPKDVDELASQMEGLEVDGKMSVYDRAFEQHPVAVGKAISKKERDATEQSGDSTLVYGEITFKTLALALHKVKTKYGLPGVGSSGDRGVLQEPGGVFYDIGSGTGKPVIAAALVHHFHKAVGVEILEGLHATSMQVLKDWEGRLRNEIGYDPPTKVEFIHGDALDPDVCDWTDGDVVFANSTCFDDTLMRRLASAATAMKKGSIFITLTKRVPAMYFKVLEHDMYPMSWGSATVYMAQKITDPYGDPNDLVSGEGTE